jgi:hypothetical protein
LNRLQVLVYPNPATSTVNIATGSYANLSFMLYDLNGKLLLQEKLNSSKQSISVDHLPAGMYIYRVLQGQSLLESSRLIIQ